VKNADHEPAFTACTRRAKMSRDRMPVYMNQLRKKLKVTPIMADMITSPNLSLVAKETYLPVSVSMKTFEAYTYWKATVAAKASARIRRGPLMLGLLTISSKALTGEYKTLNIWRSIIYAN